jgi:integrase
MPSTPITSRVDTTLYSRQRGRGGERMSKRKRANGAGSVHYRAGRGWCAVFTRNDGRKRYAYRSTEKAAREWLEAQMVDARRGLPSVDERETLGAYMARWLERVVVQPRYRPSTIHGYTWAFRSHINPALGRLRLAELTGQSVQDFLDEKRRTLSASSLRTLRAALSGALKHAERAEVVGRNVARLTTIVGLDESDEPDLPLIEREAAQQMLDAIAGDEYEALYLLALTTGMREGELLGLRWQDVSLEDATLNVRWQIQWEPRREGEERRRWSFARLKTKRSRRALALPTLAVVALRAHRTRQIAERLRLADAREEHDLVFPAPDGRPLTGEGARRRWQRLCRLHGLAVMRFHDLRHAAASLLLSEHVELATISRILGHSGITITERVYTKVARKLHREAAEAMDRLLTTRGKEALG